MSSSSNTTATSTVTTDGLTFRCVTERRRVLPRNQAQEIFAPLLENPYNTVVLGGYAFGDGAACVAGAALLELAKKKCVRKIVFADCIASLPKNEAIRTLRSLCSSIGNEWKGLHSVDLSDNTLGSFGISECAPVLRDQTELQHLRLARAGLAAESARLLKSFIAASPTTRLRTLNVHFNRIESTGTISFAEIVEKSPDLECLRLSSLGARANAIARVAFAINGKAKLRDLNLSDNLLDLPAADALGNVLVTLPNLERLALRDLDMKDPGLNALLKGLISTKRKPALSSLALAGNELSAVAAPILESMLFEYADTLKSLDLSRNSLGSTTVQSLTDALTRAREAGKEVALTKLSLAKNHLSALSIVRLVMQLISISDFELLDIMENRIPEDVNKCISNALGTGTALCDTDNVSIDSDGEGSAPPTEITQELQAAMEQLANTPSRVRRAIRFSENRTEVSEQSSSQSNSTVSRLRSLFSKGSEKENEQLSSRFRGALEGASPPLESAPPGSIQDDSGVIEDYSESGAPGASSPAPTGDKTTVLPSTISSGEKDTEDAMATPSNSGSVRIMTSPEQPESARKLKKSLASLQQEFTNLSSEFTPSPPSVYTAGGNMYDDSLNGPSNVNDYLLSGELSQDDTGKQTALGALVNILGGLLIGAFLIILVLAIVQSLEGSTFAYRPV